MRSAKNSHQIEFNDLFKLSGKLRLMLHVNVLRSILKKNASLALTVNVKSRLLCVA